MFCPNCRYEYLPGVTTCPDCGATLVYKLPPESKDEEHFEEPPEMETAYVTSDLSLVAAAKSMLEEAGIKYNIPREGRLYSYPMPMVEIQVEVTRLSEAKDLLSALDKSEIAPDQSPLDEDKEP